MEKLEKWCECETVGAVYRDGKSTCVNCGGIDAYKKDPNRQARQTTELTSIELPEDVVLMLALQAHKLNITLNQHVTNIMVKSAEDEIKHAGEVNGS